MTVLTAVFERVSLGQNDLSKHHHDRMSVIAPLRTQCRNHVLLASIYYTVGALHDENITAIM